MLIQELCFTDTLIIIRIWIPKVNVIKNIKKRIGLPENLFRDPLGRVIQELDQGPILSQIGSILRHFSILQIFCKF